MMSLPNLDVFAGLEEDARCRCQKTDGQESERLRRLKGRFILSINDLPNVRAVFSGFKVAPVSLTYTITSGKGTPAKELIITR